MYRSVSGVENVIKGFCWKSAQLVGFLAAFTVFLSESVHAQTSDIFTVRNVPVDATADEAAEARIIAIRQGRALALRILFQRWTMRTDWPLLPVLKTREVTTMGAGFEVSGEKNSPTRYLATITYRFKPDEVRRVLRETSIPFSEARARSAIVLPVLVRGGEINAWGEENIWRDLWLEREYSNELLPVLMPLGDLGDALAAPREAIISGDYYRLARFAERYGVQDVIIAAAIQDDEGQPLRLEIARLTPTAAEGFLIDSPMGEDEAAAYTLAIDRVVERLQEDWKAKTIIRYGQREDLVVSARFESLDEWLSIRRAIEDTPSIVENQLHGVSTSGAEMTLSVVGSTDQLALSLIQKNILLSPIYDEATAGQDFCSNVQAAGVTAGRCADSVGNVIDLTGDASGSIGSGPLPGREGVTSSSVGDSGFFDFLDNAISSAPEKGEPIYWLIRFEEQIADVTQQFGSRSTYNGNVSRNSIFGQQGKPTGSLGSQSVNSDLVETSQ